MLKKSPFFDFLNRREDTDFHQYLANSVENADFIDWNNFLLPNDYGDAGIESTWAELDGEVVQVMLSCPPLLKFERARQVPAPI